jgi:hypothetical protein
MPNPNSLKFNEYRRLGEILNVTFTFARTELKPLFKSMLILAMPLLILLGIVLGIFQAENLPLFQDAGSLGIETMSIENIQNMIIQYGLIMVIYYLSSTVISVIVLGYIVEYINNGPQVPFENVLAQVKVFLPRVLAVNLVYYIIVVIGSILFFVPGIYFAISLALCPIVIVMEDTGIGGSIKRSMYFVRGYWWRTLGYFIVIGLIYLLISIVFSIPSSILSGMQAFGFISAAPDSPGMLMLAILVNIISTVSYLFSALVVIFMTFYYYSQYELKEAGNLMRNIDDMAGNN